MPLYLPNLLVSFYPVIPLIGATALSSRLCFTYTVMLAPFLLTCYPPSKPLDFRIEEVLLYLILNLGRVAALTWLLRQARELDAVNATRVAEVIDLHTQKSRTRSREESNNFIHDHILSVLKAAVTLPTGSPQLRASARHALTRLDEATQSPPTRPSALIEALTHLTTDLPDSTVTVTAHVLDDSPVPPDVAHALLEASGEALRNSLAHAGGGEVRRTLTLNATEQEFSVTIADDGRGFDPDTVPAGRFGVHESIVGAVERSGGTARIDTAPGDGTTITLSWQRSALARRSPGTPSERITLPLTLAACLESRIVRVTSALICVGYVFIVRHEIRAASYHSSLPSLAGLALGIVAAGFLLWSWPNYRVPTWAAGTVAILPACANALTLFSIAFPGWPGYASWSIGMGTAIACGLMARHRPGWSWTALVLTAVATTVWGIVTGHTITITVMLSIGHVLTLAVWHVATSLSLRLSARTAHALSQRTEVVALQHAEEASQELMREVMDSVRARVTPILTPIADGAPLTDTLRTRARLLDAELRDERRAPFFTGTPVTAAAKAARQRGVEVTLMDDHGTEPLSTIAQRTALTHAVRALQKPGAQQVVIRLLPPHRRPDLMTIMTDDGTDADIRTVRV